MSSVNSSREHRVHRLIKLISSGNLLVTIENRLRSIAGQKRRLLQTPLVDHSRHSQRRVNALLDHIPQPRRYLEIGVDTGDTLEGVVAAICCGVDPSPEFDFSHLPAHISFWRCTSDEYFDSLKDENRFDVIFLDGLHTAEQTYRDLVNSLMHLEPGGAILIDDTVPSDRVSAIPDQQESMRVRKQEGLSGNVWHGDVWKVVVVLATQDLGLSFRTIVGSGNPQTLVWRDVQGAGRTHMVPEFPSGIASLDFESVFVDGRPPDYFNLTGEDEAISDWQGSRST